MKNIFLDIFNKRINEGIDIRLSPYKNVKEVSITDIHEKGVNTSITNNPTKRIYTMDDGNKVTVYSIFQRNTAIKKTDGNPLLYALKKENGYVFASPYEEKQFWIRFEKILDKFIEQYNPNTITVINQTNPGKRGTGILTPSSKPINKKIAEILNKKTGIIVIDDLVVKKTNDEIYYACANPNSYFYKYWDKKGMLDEMLEYLEDTYLTDETYFRMHSIQIYDSELRSTIRNTLKLNPECIDNYLQDINDQNILIIDDTITMCQTFKSMYNAITSVYFPKSITGLTMFSEKV